MLSLRSRALGLALVATIVGCGPGSQPRDASLDTTSDTAADALPDAPPRSLTARFQLGTAPTPRPMDIPFPSDAFLDATGHVLPLSDWTYFGVPALDVVASEYTELDGFSRTAGALFGFDGGLTVDATSLPVDGAASRQAGASVFMLDFDGAGPDARIPVVARWLAPYHTLSIVPDHVLLPAGHHVAVVVTTQVHAPDGTPASASPDFIAIRAGARATPLAMQYGDAIDRAASAASIASETIVAIAPYTTQSAVRDQLRRAHDAVVADTYGSAAPIAFDATAAAPFVIARFGAATNTGWTATLDAYLGTPLQSMGHDAFGRPLPTDPANAQGTPHDAIGAILTGTFVAPAFQRAMTAADGADSGTFAFGADGALVAQNLHAVLPVTIVLPLAPPPPTGYPVIVWGHGLGSQRGAVIDMANAYASRGVALVAIDDAAHGSRLDPTDVTSFEPGTYRGPDGLADAQGTPPIEYFGRLRNLARFRDNVRQTELDWVTLVRALRNPATNANLAAFAGAQYSATSPPALDGSRIAYMGSSNGGILGSILAAIMDVSEIDAFVIDCAGGGWLSALAVDSPQENPLLLTGAALYYRFASDLAVDRFHPLVAIGAAITDNADPALYAADVLAPNGRRGHNTIVTEVLDDEFVPNSSTTLLARAMGIPLADVDIRPIAPLPTVITPVLGNLGAGANAFSAALVQQGPATHSDNGEAREGLHEYAIPFPIDTSDPAMRFVQLPTDKRFYVPEPGDAYIAEIVTFAQSVWSGGAGRIDPSGISVRNDYDADGFDDDVDLDPSDPTVH